MQILVFIDKDAFYDCLTYISTPDVSQSQFEWGWGRGSGWGFRATK